MEPPSDRRTTACEDRDFVEWHGGSPYALVWAVEVDRDDVRAAVASARTRWGDLLLPRHQRQPHITLAYGGPVPAPGSTPVDEPFTPERLDGDLARLRALALAPFTVTLGPWGTFPMVPFLHADAPELTAVNAALMTDSPYAGGYVPHVTIGHYAVSLPITEVAARADAWAVPAVEPIEVSAVSLLAYETRDIAGPLTTVGRLQLSDARWVTVTRLPGLRPEVTPGIRLHPGQ